jgi:hypothetical protein
VETVGAVGRTGLDRAALRRPVTKTDRPRGTAARDAVAASGTEPVTIWKTSPSRWSAEERSPRASRPKDAFVQIDAVAVAARTKRLVRAAVIALVA